MFVIFIMCSFQQSDDNAINNNNCFNGKKLALGAITHSFPIGRFSNRMETKTKDHRTHAIKFR